MIALLSGRDFYIDQWYYKFEANNVIFCLDEEEMSAIRGIYSIEMLGKPFGQNIENEVSKIIRRLVAKISNVMTASTFNAW